MFDEGELGNIPLNVIAKALRAEGFLGLNGVYGPVYDHELFNLPQSDWRKASAGCEVTDTLIKKRTLCIVHEALGAGVESGRNNGTILRKIAEKASELKDYKIEE